MSEPVDEPTPMDRLREVGLLPDVAREDLRKIVADAVQEVQQRLQNLEDTRETEQRRTRRRRPRERP